MKNIFTTVIMLFVIVLGVKAQSFELYNLDDVRIDGETIAISTVVEETSDYYFTVKNVSGAEIEAKISIEVLVGPVEEAAHVLCSPITEQTGGFCGTPWGAESHFFVLNSNETSGDAHIDFSQGPNSGVTTIKYKVFETDNETNNVTFTITFSTQTSVNLAQVNSFSIFPNPAVNNFTIENSFGKDSYVEIYNILGTLVSKIESNNTSAINVDCSKWQNGYYFCRLYNDGKVEKTIKLVVAD